MPTKKPRMALTLPDDVNEAIHELAAALGTPATKVVTELLQEMVPQLQGMAKVSRALKAGKHAAAKTAMRHMMGDAMAEIMVEQQPDMFKPKRKAAKP